VVNCTGVYEGPNGTQTLNFMRLWAKKDNSWKIIGGVMY
jgi:hypothetical protein